jgi:hypothetical protein
MTTAELLKIQLRLLIAQFGRETVLGALAGLADATPEQLQEEIARFEAAKRTKRPRSDRSLAELVDALAPITDEVRNLITTLGRLYESKQFLPNLRDAEEFLRRAGATNKKHKSRRGALSAVLKVLSALPKSELESLVAQATSASGQSDYAILANQLMGRKP